ncbi:MAG TPA: hypothetical protein VGC13_17130 [Longimicrobium sp.]|jgi:hypothetical protein|uniref:hypothetical protein n=1 Tax=Longimicrobium sp. TaxID=2029185 RepID=UPI002ED8CE3B
MSLHVLLLLLSLSASADAPARSADKGCPAGSPRQAAYVRQFFAASESRPFRDRYGLLGVRPGDVRPLTDEHDAEVCRQMARAVTLAQTGPYPKTWRGYLAGDFYVMAVTRELPPGVLYHGGGTGLIVLDAEMRVIAAAS